MATTLEKEEALDCPQVCKRCGCPMALERVDAFADEQADLATKVVKRPARHTQVRTSVQK